MIAFALVMLGLCVLIALIGGFALAISRPAIGLPLLAFAAVSGWAAWSLARRRPVGYWAGFGVLVIAGIVPGALALATGVTPAAVVLAAPLLVAIAMLRPSVRTSILPRAAGDPGRPPQSTE